jgi:hypothetical protein
MLLELLEWVVHGGAWASPYERTSAAVGNLRIVRRHPTEFPIDAGRNLDDVRIVSAPAM